MTNFTIVLSARIFSQRAVVVLPRLGENFKTIAQLKLALWIRVIWCEDEFLIAHGYFLILQTPDISIPDYITDVIKILHHIPHIFTFLRTQNMYAANHYN